MLIKGKLSSVLRKNMLVLVRIASLRRILMNTHKIMFYGEIWKIVSTLSLNAHLIRFSDLKIKVLHVNQPDKVSFKQ